MNILKLLAAFTITFSLVLPSEKAEAFFFLDTLEDVYNADFMQSQKYCGKHSFDPYIRCMSGKGHSWATNILSSSYPYITISSDNHVRYKQHWIYAVNEYCVDSQVFGAGRDYNGFYNCLRERGIQPSAKTVKEQFTAKVQQHCFNSLGSGIQLAITVADVSFEVYSTAKGLYFISKDVSSGIADFAKDETVNLVTASIFSGGLDWVSEISELLVPPAALVDYKKYQQCLVDRSLPDLKFVSAMDTNNQGAKNEWRDMVGYYCGSSWGSYGEDYSRCLLDRGIPVAGFSSYAEYLGHECKLKYPSNIRGREAVNYKNCRLNASLTPPEENELNIQVYNHCKTAMVFGWANDHTGFKNCLAQRKTPFKFNNEWVSAVLQHCNNNSTCKMERGIINVNSPYANTVETLANIAQQQAQATSAQNSKQINGSLMILF